MVKKIASVALSLCITVSLFALCGVTRVKADTLEDTLLGTVSAQYESNGDPGFISSGVGDPGGASYGAYQFASVYSTPRMFFLWCISSGKGVETGNRLSSAYAADSNTFSTNFNAEWHAVANEDRAAFLSLQHDYIKALYYDKTVSGLMNDAGFNVNNYGIALKNAVWSRSVQHGVGSYSSNSGAIGLFRKIDAVLPNGILGSTEREIIVALYEESGALIDSGTVPIRAADAGSNAWIVTKYSLEGKTVKYYSGASSAVQAGVYYRLRVEELNDLLVMLDTYGTGYYPRTGWVNVEPGSYLNFRSSPDSSSSENIITLLADETQITVIEPSETDGWYSVRILHDGEIYDCYCSGDYVSFTCPQTGNVTDGDGNLVIQDFDAPERLPQFGTTVEINNDVNKITQGTGSLRMLSTSPTGQENSVGSMAFFPLCHSTDTTGYDYFAIDVYAQSACTTGVFEINLTNDVSAQDGYNYRHQCDFKAGWNKLLFSKSDFDTAVDDYADWTAVRNLRVTWFNDEDNPTTKALDVYLDNLIALNSFNYQKLLLSDEISIVENAINAIGEVTGANYIQKLSFIEAAENSVDGFLDAGEGRTVALISNYKALTDARAAYDAFYKASILYGDADLNGSVNAADSLLILQHSVEKIVLESQALVLADVDKINGVTSIDAMLVLQYSVGIISSFPAND